VVMERVQVNFWYEVEWKSPPIIMKCKDDSKERQWRSSRGDGREMAGRSGDIGSYPTRMQTEEYIASIILEDPAYSPLQHSCAVAATLQVQLADGCLERTQV
jgi:hypothetical protein